MSPLSGAQWALDQGWRVFPLRPRDKTPAVKGWPHVASRDPSQLAAWSVEYPGCNFGIPTGNGLAVVDVDGPEGAAAVGELEQSGLVLPPTLLVHTNRGAHRYYWTEVEIRNSTSLLAEHVDVRGTGGYVVAPGSIHPAGGAYKLEDRPEFVSQIASLPKWVIQRLTTRRENPVTLPSASGAAGRNSALASLAGAMRRKGCSSLVILAALEEQNKTYDSPLEDKDLRTIAESIARYPPQERGREGIAQVVCLESVPPRPIDWLSPGWLAYRTVSLLSGDPGVGKTWLALAMAANLSRGITPITGEPCRPGKTLYLSRENPVPEVVVPRLVAHEADLTMIRYLDIMSYGGNDHPVTLADIDGIEGVVTAEGIRLVLFDPIQSYLGADVDAHRANETRPIMDRLAGLAERTGCCVLLLRHLNKASSGKALHRGQGSVDFTGAARTELFAEDHPSEKERRVLALAKSNLGRIPDSLLWGIENSRVVWHGSCSLRADDLAGTPTSESEGAKLEEAKDFLRSELIGGPVSAGEILSRAGAAGIAEKTLRRAKGELRVGSKKVTVNEVSQWAWVLP